MKRPFLALWFLAATLALHAEEPHTFTATDGRTLKATIVSKTDTHVTIRRAEDGQEFQLPLERLSAADQAFLKAWTASAAAAASTAAVKWKKTWVIEPNWDAVRSPMEGMTPVKVGGKWGFVDDAGKVVSEVKWEKVGNFVEGLAAVSLAGKWGFIDKTGKVVIEPAWDEAQHFQEGLAPVKKGALWGFIDKTGQVAIPPAFEEAFTFTEGLACVMKGGLYGFIDPTGKVVIDLTWARPGRYSHGHVVLTTKEGEGGVVKVFNQKGSSVFEMPHGSQPGLPVWLTEHGIIGSEHFWNSDPNDTRAPKAFLMNFDGRIIHEQAIRAKIEFHEGLAAVWLQDNQITFINPKGERAFKTIFVAPEFKMLAHHETPQYRFSEGLVAVPGRDPEKKHKLRYLDKNGTVVIPARFTHAGPFSEGLAFVSNTEGYPNEKTVWKIINRDGVDVADVSLPPGSQLPFYYTEWFPGFKHGRTAFEQRFTASSKGSDSRVGFVGADGQVAIPAVFHSDSVINSFENGAAVVSLSTLRSFTAFTDQAIIDARGKVIASPVRGSSDRKTYRGSEARTDGPTVCGAGPRRFGLVNAAGKIVVPPGWEDAQILSPDLIAFQKDGKFGLVDGKGAAVLPASITGVDFVDVLSATHVWVRKDGQTGCLHTTTGEFTPQEKPDYQRPVPDRSADAFALFQENQLYGIKAKDGTVTLPPKYPAAYRASGTRFWVSDDKDGNINFALITETGKALTEFEWFPSRSGFSSGLTLVKKTFAGDSGYMDENGKLILPLTPGRKSDFAHGVAMVFRDGESGLINPKGEWIFKSSAEAELAEIGFTNIFNDFFQHGLALVEVPMKWGLIKLTPETK
ncbi:MAG: WG repeat-containing protein [Verrucomicrobiaceae bacterium]